MEREWRYVTAEVMLHKAVNTPSSGEYGVSVQKSDLITVLDELREQRIIIRELRAERLKHITTLNRYFGITAILAGCVIVFAWKLFR